MSTGPEQGTAAGRGHLRAAHADREDAVSLLKDAFVAGRLTRDELGARVGQALSARTYADLAAVTADIPAPQPAVRASAQRPARPRSRTAPAPAARTAAIIAVTSLTAAFVSLGSAVRLDDPASTWLILLTIFLLLVAKISALSAALEVGRARGQLPPDPGEGGEPPAVRGHGHLADDPPAPGAHDDQTRCDMWTRRDFLAAPVLFASS